jgi:hypothetical protein
MFPEVPPVDLAAEASLAAAVDHSADARVDSVAEAFPAEAGFPGSSNPDL